MERIEVQSHSGASTYIVTRDEDQGGRWTCTCPHWVYRCNDSGDDCKHIDEVVQDHVH